MSNGKESKRIDAATAGNELRSTVYVVCTSIAACSHSVLSVALNNNSVRRREKTLPISI